MEDIMKIVKSLKHSGLLIKGVRETIQSQKKNNKKVDFLVCYKVLQVKVYLGNILTGQEVN